MLQRQPQPASRLTHARLTHHQHRHLLPPSAQLDDALLAAAGDYLGGGGGEEEESLDVPKVLARFRVNQCDTLAVFKACTKEDFRDVITLLPENTPLPASDKMTYLLARLEVRAGGWGALRGEYCWGQGRCTGAGRVGAGGGGAAGAVRGVLLGSWGCCTGAGRWRAGGRVGGRWVPLGMLSPNPRRQPPPCPPCRRALQTTGADDLMPALRRVARGDCSMEEAVGPAVGCLMATFGTNMISSCIFDFDDPEELEVRRGGWGPPLGLARALLQQRRLGAAAVAAAAPGSCRLLRAASCRRWRRSPPARQHHSHTSSRTHATPPHTPPPQMYSVEERIELWGLQIPHNSMRPSLAPDQAMIDAAAALETGEVSVPATPMVPPTPMTAREREVVAWSSVDRLNMSIGLLYALCNYALDNDVRCVCMPLIVQPVGLPSPARLPPPPARPLLCPRAALTAPRGPARPRRCGFCVPRPQLLRRWLQHGVRMRQIPTPVKLIYPPSAHDYDYYKASTVAYFMVDGVKAGLAEVLGLLA